MKYQKKPIVVEAFRFGWNMEPNPDWFNNAIESAVVTFNGGLALIRTPEGTAWAAPGDWIIKGVVGELSPCKPDVFEATYEQVELP